jgi:hypothetical protein
MESRGSYLISQAPSSGLYSEPDESIPHYATLSIHDPS